MSLFFDNELNELKSNLIMMGEVTFENVTRATRALLESDLDLAQIALNEDSRIDTLELQIDREAMRYISLRSPVASDLRFVTTAMKICHEFERIGDEACGIAKRAFKLSRKSPLNDFLNLPEMSKCALEMLRDSIDSLIEADMPKATALLEKDSFVNNCNKENRKTIRNKISEDPRISYQGIELMFVSKCYERIGDHATNIAEEVIYIVSGEDIRHTTIDPSDLSHL